MSAGGEVVAGTPNIADVADLAGVAPSSVSRVLSSHPNVSEAMRAKVMAAAEALGYLPDLNAAGLRKGRTHAIGVIVRDLSSPLYAEILHGIEVVLREANYSTLVANSDGNPTVGLKHLELFRRRRVDGLILSLDADLNSVPKESLEKSPGPVVLLDREIPPELSGNRVSAVHCEHHDGVVAAMDHILAVGHRRIAFVGAPTVIRPARERLRGYESALQKHGLARDPELIRSAGQDSEAAGRKVVAELMSLPSPPTAILAGGVQLAEGALLALQGLPSGQRRAMAVISCDSVPLMELSDVNLTVVDRDRESIGRLAASRLLAMLEEGSGGEVVTVPTSVRTDGGARYGE